MNIFDTWGLANSAGLIDFAVLTDPTASKRASFESDGAPKDMVDFKTLVAPPGVETAVGIIRSKDPTPAAPEDLVENAVDFFKSVPRGAFSSAHDAASRPGPFGVPLDDYYLDQEPLREAAKEAALKYHFHTPQGTAGKFGNAIGEGLGNPYSYFGPGSAWLKAIGAVVSSAAGEAAGQAADGTKLGDPSPDLGKCRRRLRCWESGGSTGAESRTSDGR